MGTEADRRCLIGGRGVREAPADWNAFAEWYAGLAEAYVAWAAKTANLIARATAPDAPTPSARIRCLLELWREMAAGDVLPPRAEDGR